MLSSLPNSFIAIAWVNAGASPDALSTTIARMRVPKKFGALCLRERRLSMVYAAHRYETMMTAISKSFMVTKYSRGRSLETGC